MPHRKFATVVVLMLIISVQAFGQFTPGGYPLSPAEKDRMAREDAALAEREARETKRRLDDATAMVDREERTMGREYDPAYREQRIRKLATAPLAEAAAGLRADIAVAPDALGDATADLVYTPVAPCRIIDTRVAGGIVTAGSARNFLVAGTSGFPAQGGTDGGCGVPLGPATVAHINFVAAGPTGSGNLRAWAYGATEPASSSIINYQLLSPNLNVANAVNVPICPYGVACTFDMTVRANINSVHVVADVLGYFSRVPKEQVRSFVVRNRLTSTVNIAATCTNYGSITVVAPVAGSVTVRANWQVNIVHTNGSDSNYGGHLGTTNSSCPALYGYDSFAYLPAVAPTGGYFPVVPLSKTFPVVAGTHTFYLNGIKSSGNSADHWWAGLEAEFNPD